MKRRPCRRAAPHRPPAAAPPSWAPEPHPWGAAVGPGAVRCPPLLPHARPDSGPGLRDTATLYLALPQDTGAPSTDAPRPFPWAGGVRPSVPSRGAVGRWEGWTKGVDREFRLLRRRGAPRTTTYSTSVLSCSKGEGPSLGRQPPTVGRRSPARAQSKRCLSEEPPLVPTGIAEAPPLPASKEAPPGPLQPSMDLSWPLPGTPQAGGLGGR